MDNAVINKILLGNDVQAIQIHLTSSGKEYRFIEVSRKKNNLTITDRFVTRDVDALISKISKNKPILISITGNGIITKKTTVDDNYKSKIIFNAAIEDFHWFEYKEKETLYITAARKEVVEKEVQFFEKQGILIVGLSLGVLGVTSLKSLIEESTLHTQNIALFFENEVLINFEKEEYNGQKYTLGEEEIKGTELVCFASVVNYLYPNDAIISDDDIFAKNEEEFKFKKAFNFLGILVLIFFLGSLLLSYFLLGYYQQANHEVQVKLGEQNVAYSKLVSLEKDKENKKEILKESGLNDSNFLTFYLSEITSELPSQISINELIIFPTTTKIKPKQRIHFINDLIEVKGEVASYESFTNWIKSIKKYSWINSLEIIDFKNESGSNLFIIHLKLKFNV